MQTKIKVLHIIKTLSLGGAEVNLLNLLRVLDQDKFELHVAYSYGGELEPKFKEAGIQLCKYAERDHWQRRHHRRERGGDQRCSGQCDRCRQPG